MNTPDSATERVTTASLVADIAHLLRHNPAISAGDVAALRRMDPRRPHAAFFKIEGLILDSHLDGDADARQDQETRWAAIILGLAYLGPLHDASQRLGLALAEAQYSELRFSRLLNADVEQLVDHLPTLARFLAAKRTPVDWTAAARLLLTAGDLRREETTRRHIARDYYGVLARQGNR